MTAGARRLFAALAILLLPVGAAAEVRLSPGDAPRERERFVDPAPPRAQPGGDSISLPSDGRPPGRRNGSPSRSPASSTPARPSTAMPISPRSSPTCWARTRARRGLDLARRITAKYGAAGYVLSRAIVPPQNFGRDGAVIRIQAVEGYVDQVIWRVEKLTRYRDFFTDYSRSMTADRPANVRTLERYLLSPNDLPGLKFSTTLKPSPTHPNASILIV